ncbi:MAG: phosphoenolpyruvate carboxylase [bacterium]|nr:phosphoenolpyruvate carboxylase [bacterium]
MRKIPAIMFSQHPDHANNPYWQDEAFIEAKNELKECFLSFSELGADEYMWDWEGKYTDESFFEKTISTYYDFFSRNPIGVNLFITLRLPNPNTKADVRLARALTVMLTATEFTRRLHLPIPPLFEAIVPMCENTNSLLSIQLSFNKLKQINDRFLRIHNKKNRLELIPLFEKIPSILNSKKIIEEYIMLANKNGNQLSYIRPLLGRSDPALHSGIVSTTLAIKIALSDLSQVKKKHGVSIYPIISSGILPFRGGLDPKNIQSFMNEYAGIATVIVQSAFRYDFSKNEVNKGIQLLKKLINKTKTIKITDEDKQALKQLIFFFEKKYQEIMHLFAPIIADAALFFPVRRERLVFTGIQSYGRKINGFNMPRSIPFTGTLYALGFPPELAGTAGGLKKAIETKKDNILHNYYLNFKNDIRYSGRYLNRTSIKKWCTDPNLLKKIIKEINFLESYFSMKLGPQDSKEHKHAELSEQFVDELKGLRRKEKLLQLNNEMGILRKTLG